MKAIVTYLNFDGNCREAMKFYQRCLGGELSIMPFSEAPGDFPKEAKDRVMHARVTKEGTAPKANLEQFTVAGKTGTAQKVNPQGGYDHGKYVVSFVGYLPADHPEFVGLVVLDDAHTSKPELNYGGLVAGPIFSRVGEKAARYLDLEPHEEIRKAIPVQRVEKSKPAERIRKPAPAERIALTDGPRR